MSFWEKHGLWNKILDVLNSVPNREPGHHFKRPFLTAYQIAIELSQRHPEDLVAFGHPLGGVGIEEHTSYAQYIALELSKKVRDDASDGAVLDGAGLSNWHLKNLSFKNGKEKDVVSSLRGTNYPLSMFRLRS